MILALFFVFSGYGYPFLPIQLSLIGALTVGFPSFVLALQPNNNIVRGNFTANILLRAAPAAVCISLGIMITAIISGVTGTTQEELSTIAVYLTSLIGLLLIVRLSIPINLLRAVMLALSVAGLAIAFVFFPGFFNLAPLGTSALITIIVCSAVGIVLFNLLYNLADKLIERYKKQKQQE